MKQNYKIGILLISFLGLFAGCTAGSKQVQTDPSGSRLKVVATTNIVGDVVQQIGGDNLELSTLLPAGSDPHSYQPTPQDIARVADADLVFMNGLGLEEFMQALIDNAGGDAHLVTVSDGIEPLVSPEDSGHEGEGPNQEDEQQGQDPHVWTDPNNILVWTENIAAALSKNDPDNAETYAANAQAYQQQLRDLDEWIRVQVAQIPEANRKLVSDHTVFAYFARQYGLEQAGAVIPSYSTLAEPSAQELAALEDTIRSQGIRAIFVGDTVNPSLAQRIAEDTGVSLVFVHTGSLTGPEGNTPTYLDFIRYNVTAITSALK